MTKMLYRDTDLILLPKPVGDKYTTATKYNKPTLNLAWLRDMLIGKEVDESTWNKSEYKVQENQALKGTNRDLYFLVTI